MWVRLHGSRGGQKQKQKNMAEKLNTLMIAPTRYHEQTITLGIIKETTANVAKIPVTGQ